MNYDNHTTLELKSHEDTLLSSSFDYFGQNLKHFLDLLEQNQALSYLLNEVRNQYQYSEEQIKERMGSIENGEKEFFINQGEHVSFCYNWLNYRTLKHGYNIHHFAGGYEGKERISGYVRDFIIPIVKYLTHRLTKANSIVYLMERYKRRTEWFTKELLLKQYNLEGTNYEEIFEKDLRLFLFDQGIDFPLSSPKLQTGRADIVSQLDSDEPILVEVKFIHKERGYGKERIIKGYRQIQEYVRSYRKNFGFLVIYNLDAVEIIFDFESSSEVGFPSMSIEGRTYFFVVVNLSESKAPSKISRKEEVIIQLEDLLNESGTRVKNA